MEHRTLGMTGLDVSLLGMGCAKLGSASAGYGRRRAVRLVAEAYDSGVRLFDTADAYGAGASESILGEALAGRTDAVIATKVGYRFRERSAAERALRRLAGSARGVVGAARGRVASRSDDPAPHVASGAYTEHDFSTPYIRAAVVASMRRLRVERIDLLQFHGPPPPEHCALPEVAGTLIDDGVIGAFGIGCERLDAAAAWVEVPGLASIQLPFGVLDPQAAATTIPRARALGVGILLRGVLGGGVLARFVRGETTGLDPLRQTRVEQLAALAAEHGVDVLQLAVWYALRVVPADAILLGITSAEQLASNVAMVATPLDSSETIERIRSIVDAGGA
ncbi:MAG: aldo/keto reductase [Ilumatobacteraceae bacterium]|nr:aldo/keto reductase [Ilumatobacteraceae bacterium]